MIFTHGRMVYMISRKPVVWNKNKEYAHYLYCIGFRLTDHFIFFNFWRRVKNSWIFDCNFGPKLYVIVINNYHRQCSVCGRCPVPGDHPTQAAFRWVSTWMGDRRCAACTSKRWACGHFSETVRLHWKLHIVTAALQNYKFVENLWEICVSLLAVYVTLQQPQKV